MPTQDDLSHKHETVPLHTTPLCNTPLYIAPANPAARSLAAELKQQGYQVQGFIDNLKTGADILNQPNTDTQDATILVCTGQFQLDIALGLKEKGFAQRQIVLQVENEHQTNKLEYRPFTISACLAWGLYKKRIALTGVHILARCIRGINRLLGRRLYLYYAEGFVDSNTLIAWRYHQKQHPDEVRLLGVELTTNYNDYFYQQLQQEPTAVVSLKPLGWRGFWLLMRATHVVLDHEYNSLVFRTVRPYKSVLQMHHGLPLKYAAGNQHFSYIMDDYFISSSKWFNDKILKDIFNAKQHLATGYPRSDALLQKAEERDWFGAPSYEYLQHLVEHTGPLIVYMPTFRDNGNNDYPLDLELLNTWCEQHHYSFILKYHPFLANQLTSKLLQQEPYLDRPTPLPGLPHLYVFPVGLNVYPWLAETELLITDYSSIFYDFLFTKKNIIFYQFDHQDYLDTRGDYMVDIHELALGPVVTEFSKLLEQMSSLLSTTLIKDKEHQANSTSADTEEGKAESLYNKAQQEALLHFQIPQYVSAPFILELIRTGQFDEQAILPRLPKQDKQ